MNDFQFIYDDLIPINYNGEKQTLISDLEQIYKNTENIIIDWQIRENSIRKIGQICIGDSKKTDIFLKFFNVEIISNLALQLADLRSSVMKEACRIVSLCGKELGNLAEVGAVHLLSRIILFKIAGSANRVIADSSSKCILNLVKYVNSVKIINNICEQKNIKSNFVRAICSQCILYIVTCYKKNLLLNKIQILQETIKYLISDPNGDVRSIIRRAFITLKKRLPGEAENVYKLLEKNIQKQINEDEKKYGNKIVIDEENISRNIIEFSPINQKFLYSSSHKPKSHEIKFKLKEISGIKKINYNNNQSEINLNNNNILNVKDKNLFNNNINNNTINILNKRNNNEINIIKSNINQMSKPLYKSAKNKKHVGIFYDNSNTIKINHKDILKKLNEKFANYNKNNDDNDNKSSNNVKVENILPPINQFNPSLNKSQNYKKCSRSVLQNNKKYIKINNDNDNVNNNINENLNNAMNNNYIPIIKENIKIINNNINEKDIINKIEQISFNIDTQEKIKIFQYFFNNFNNVLDESQNFSENILGQFISIHIQNLKENDISLISQLIKNLIKIVFYMDQKINNNNIQSLVKLIIKKIYIGEKSICNLCYKLLDLIRKKGKIEDIYNGIFISLEENNIKNNDICYEYLAYLINKYGIIFGNNSYYERIFQLIYNANINSKKIKRLIGELYKNNPDNFIKLYYEENNNNQTKIISIIEKNNLNFIQELKGKIEINTIKNVNTFDNSINNKIKKIISEVKKKNNNNIINNNLSDEIKINFENGNVKLFLSYIENNINYLPSFIMILTTENYTEHKYIKNYLNFIYSLISYSNKFSKEILQNMNILIEQIINILYSNKEDSIFINSIKEILYILPIKINSQQYFKEISKYLNDNSDIQLLQILIGSIKNFIIYDKNKNLEKQIPFFINGIINLLEHNSSEIRKPAIYCCVEMYNIMKDSFIVYFEQIPKNSQKIINQLIKKKI